MPVPLQVPQPTSLSDHLVHRHGTLLDPLQVAHRNPPAIGFWSSVASRNDLMAHAPASTLNPCATCPATTLDRKREIPAETATRWYNLTITTKSFRFSNFFFPFWFQTPYKLNSSDKIKTKKTPGKHFLRREYEIEKKESEEEISKCSQTRTCLLLQYEIVERWRMNSCAPNKKKNHPNIFLKKSQKSQLSHRMGIAKKFVIRTPRKNRQRRISKNRESSRKKMAMADTSLYQNSNCSNPI